MNSAADIIAALGGNPNNGMCHCPAHDDQNPSLHVSEKNGKVLVKCHTGCSQEAVIERLRAGGLWNKNKTTMKTNKQPFSDQEHEYHTKFVTEAWPILRAAAENKAGSTIDYLQGRSIDLMPESLLFLSRQSARKLQSKIAGFKPYPAMVAPIIGVTGLQGVLVTYLTRDGRRNLHSMKSKKNIRRIYGKGKGGYIQLGKIDRAKPPKKLYIGEGIETALSPSMLTNYHPAIAVPGGNFIDITPPPAAELILVADNDASGQGLKKAQDAASLWASMGRSVQVALAPDRYNDWNDAIRDPKADRDKLRHLLLNGEAVAAEDYEVRALGMGQFIDLTFPPRQFLLRPWLTTTGLTMIDGTAGSGKTWLALSIAYAVASGKPLMEWTVERPGKVLYVDGELPGELLQTRLKRLGPPLPEADFHVLSRSQFEMRGAMMPDLGTPEGRGAIDAEIERLGIELVILDSVSTLVRSGMDNDVESWRAIQDWSLTHRARGRAVIYLHHHGRSGNPRGTSAREIVLDARIKLVRDETLSTDQETAFKLEFPKAREFFGPDAAPMISYMTTQSGVVEWRREFVKDNTREQVSKLSSAGYKPSEIAKELNLSRGRISQIMKEIRLVKDAAKGTV